MITGVRRQHAREANRQGRRPTERANISGGQPTDESQGLDGKPTVLCRRCQSHLRLRVGAKERVDGGYGEGEPVAVVDEMVTRVVFPHAVEHRRQRAARVREVMRGFVETAAEGVGGEGAQARREGGR